MSQSIQAKECVILLHGLARTENSMMPLAKELESTGYQVVNQSYESTKHTIEELSMMAIPSALSKCVDAQQIHFVTHSLGGILVRQYLKHQAVRNLGRVVMLGPPNQGSQVVDNMKDVLGFQWMNGPAGMQLGTEKGSVPNSIGPANFDLGIIAGTSSINWLLSLYLPNPDDGKVSVANTKLKGMNDHISLAVTHTFMMTNKQVINQVLYYLREGQFKRKEP